MPTNVVMPQMGESVAEGTITRWLKKPGDRIERDEPLFEITTDKVDAEIPSPASGILTKILARENETVPVNTVVAIIDGQDAVVAPEAAPKEAPAPAPGVEAPATPPAVAAEAARVTEQYAARPVGKIRSSPLVRRIAREHNVDLALVKGTGLGGRISKKDILAFLEHPTPARAGAQPAKTTQAAPPVAPAGQAISFTGPTHVVPMTPQRRQIAEHMALSKKTSAHVTTVFEVDMSRIVELRERSAEEFERRHGLKLT